MDYIKYFSKYKRLFKTKKAVEYFVKSYKNIDKRVEIMKYYWPKTGKPM